MERFEVQFSEQLRRKRPFEKLDDDFTPGKGLLEKCVVWIG
jgi:hypothetical protein